MKDIFNISRFFAQIILFICVLILESSAIKPSREYIKTPKDFKMDFEAVTFKTSDNFQLTGWFIPAEQDTQNTTIIFSMIDGGNMSYIIEMTEYFVKRSFNVLLYDYRGFGKSQDFKIIRDYLIHPEFITDLHAAVDFVKSKNDDKIVLFGFSMGAAVSIGTAGQRNDIAAVIADGAHTTIESVCSILNQRPEQERKGRITEIPPDFPAEAQPLNAVQNFAGTGLCLLTGTNDKTCTPAMAYELFKKCPSSKKTLYIASDTEHCWIHEKYGKLYFDFVLSFINHAVE